MANLIEFELTTPERRVMQGKVRQITVPTSEGEITVLPGHVALVAPVVAGELRAVSETGEEMLMAVSGGFIQIQPDGKVIIMADTAERAEELDFKAITEAKKRAEDLLKQKITDEERMADATGVLARELARLKVATKHRAKGGPRPASQE